MKNKTYRFKFTSGTIEVPAFNETEAEILAKAEAIKRGWDYRIIKEEIQHMDFFMDWAKLTHDESIQLRQLLTKAQATDIYKEKNKWKKSFAF
jgi:hypothetical protein